MRTIKLDVNDNVYDKVMFFLTNLPKSDVQLKVEYIEEEEDAKKLRAISIKTKGFEFDREDANAR